MGSINCKNFSSSSEVIGSDKNDESAENNDKKSIDLEENNDKKSNDLDEMNDENNELPAALPVIAALPKTSELEDLADTDDVEQIVCDILDIKDNEMKEFTVGGEHKILLIRQYGNLTATGTKCSHYGAPLINGLLGDGHVKCPWHGACFNTRTGDIEDFPGLDSIPCHAVRVENNKVIVRAKKAALENDKRIKSMVKRDPENESVFVIIGGGPAGGVCAESLRQEGFTGQIIMLCKEEALPYDRIKVTKAMDLSLEQLQYRKMEFYNEHDIEIMLGVSATKMSTAEKTITCSNNLQIKYEKVFIATGSEPKLIPLPNSKCLENIMTIRKHGDAQKIVEVLNSDDDINVVFLGSGFIALEGSSYIQNSNKAKSVSIVYKNSFPLENGFGKEIGSGIAKLCQEKNIKLYPHNNITKCLGTDGKISGVVLETGETLPCELLIMAVGSRPATEFLEYSGIKVNGFGSIDTDNHLKAEGCACVYVGGDAANAPLYSKIDKLATIGHYQLAQYHGKIAAANMVGNTTELDAVPFFWTQLFGKNFRFSGYGHGTEAIVEGSIDDFKFIVYYADLSGNIVSVASCNYDPVVSQFAELLKQGKKLHKKDVKNLNLKWVQQLNRK